MVRLNRIYTRTGDAGDSGLVDGSRASKGDPIFAAIGDVDEANAAIGLALESVDDPQTRDCLDRIQNDLFDLGADLATPGKDFAATGSALRITPEQVERLEHEIDAVNEGLAPLKSFILPAGSGGAAALHLGRTITRRAERSAVAAGAGRQLNPLVLAYLNRLSDLLFVLARAAALRGGEESLWRPGATREP